MSRELFDNPTETPRHPVAGMFSEWRLYEFANGWGASVIRGVGSYGGPELWEVAVKEGLHGRLNYQTPITNDVIGWLDEDGVEKVLQQIAALPKRRSPASKEPTIP
jgi:hypothetical protein